MVQGGSKARFGGWLVCVAVSALALSACSKKDASAADKSRLSSIEVELDQCWDLLRQRRAKREFGDDPNQARVRPPGIVENYEQ